jgi:hypothetical protein
MGQCLAGSFSKKINSIQLMTIWLASACLGHLLKNSIQFMTFWWACARLGYFLKRIMLNQIKSNQIKFMTI